eukprot:gene34338-42350_t
MPYAVSAFQLCPPVIGVDGSHYKPIFIRHGSGVNEKVKQLYMLMLSGRSPNNNMIVFAYAIVSTKEAATDFTFLFDTCKAVVNIRQRICECFFWQSTGIPCRHAAAAFIAFEIYTQHPDVWIGMFYEFLLTENWHKLYNLPGFQMSLVGTDKVRNATASGVYTSFTPQVVMCEEARPKTKRIKSNGDAKTSTTMTSKYANSGTVPCRFGCGKHITVKTDKKGHSEKLCTAHRRALARHAEEVKKARETSAPHSSEVGEKDDLSVSDDEDLDLVVDSALDVVTADVDVAAVVDINDDAVRASLLSGATLDQIRVAICERDELNAKIAAYLAAEPRFVAPTMEYYTVRVEVDKTKGVRKKYAVVERSRPADEEFVKAAHADFYKRRSAKRLADNFKTPVDPTAFFVRLEETPPPAGTKCFYEVLSGLRIETFDSVE